MRVSVTPARAGVVFRNPGPNRGGDPVVFRNPNPGPNRGGRGTASHFGLDADVDLIGGTFSKSLASIGGWLVGERKVLDYIQHFAYSFLFAASAAPPCVAAAMASLEVMQEETWRQDKLRENFTYMREQLRAMGFELGKTETAVIPDEMRKRLEALGYLTESTSEQKK